MKFVPVDGVLKTLKATISKMSVKKVEMDGVLMLQVVTTGEVVVEIDKTMTCNHHLLSEVVSEVEVVVVVEVVIINLLVIVHLATVVL